MANNAVSVAGTHIRVTSLNPDGTTRTGNNDSYVTSAFISVSMTPEFEDGDEFTQKAADGTVCGTVKMPDTLKRVGLEIAICSPDPDFTHLIAGGERLADPAAPGTTLGWAAPEIGTDALPNGVAIEVWSRAYENGKPAAVNPYFHWLFPYAVMRPGGDRVIENGMLATSFEGWAVGNANFGDGPAAPLWPYISDRAYAYARVPAAPTGQDGFLDLTGPTAGTLSVTTASTTADLTVTGASDETVLADAPYSYSRDAGATWTAWQAGNTYQYTGLTASTSYTFQHRVRDNAGNITVGTAVTKSTTA